MVFWVILGWFRGLVTTSVGDTSWKQSYYRMKVIQNFQLFIFINEGTHWSLYVTVQVQICM